MNVPELRANSHEVQAAPVRLRAAAPSDDDFLLQVFAGTRSDELAALSWNPAQADAFIKMQFSMQLQNYRANYPAAENSIILLNEQPIGRMLVERTAEEFRLVDIALLPEHRNAGRGSALLSNLLKEAAAASKPVKLQVLSYSPALRLYERLGFSAIAGDGVYLEMEWTG